MAGSVPAVLAKARGHTGTASPPTEVPEIRHPSVMAVPVPANHANATLAGETWAPATRAGITSGGHAAEAHARSLDQPFDPDGLAGLLGKAKIENALKLRRMPEGRLVIDPRRNGRRELLVVRPHRLAHHIAPRLRMDVVAAAHPDRGEGCAVADFDRAGRPEHLKLQRV